MSLEFELVNLGDYINITSGFAFKSKDFIEEGIPVIKIKNIIPPYVLIDDAQYVSERFLEERKNYVLRKGDVLITLTGSNVNQMASAVGQIARIHFDEPSLLNQRVAKISVKDEKCCNINYIYYILSTDEMHYNLASRASGSANQANISPDTIKEMEVLLPPLHIQNKIVNILNKIDEKIVINEKINHNLEETIKNIFKYFFVDFIPFENDLVNGIPRGWHSLILGDVVSNANTGADAIKKAPIVDFDTGIKCVRVGDMTNSRRVTEWAFSNVDEENYEKYQLKKDDIIVTRTATLGLNLLITEDLKAVYNNGLIRIKVDKNQVFPLFIYYCLNTSDYTHYIDSIEGETSTRPNMKINYLLKYPIVCPPMNIQENFIKTIKSLSELKQNLFKQTLELTKLRDTLLPKLMSGELDVSQINCDLKLFIKKFILNLTIQKWRYFNMKTKIISKIQNQMKPYLNQGQYLKLTNSLLNSFKDVEILDNNNESNEIDNFKLLNSFLSAKQVEGRSEKTIIYYKSTLEKMLTKVNKQVYNITTDDIRKYLFDHKQEKNSSKITIDNMRRIFSSFFSWLEDEDYILKNPVRRIHRVKTGRVVKEVLTDENLEILRDNCDEMRDLAIVEILISTGIRVGELVRLNIEDINFYERECVVFGKGESERVVYFDARTKIHLIKYLESRTDENPALFVSLNRPHERLGISGVETRLRELGKKCKIPKVHPHKFRRTLATNAIDKGMPIEQVQKLLGHVQIDTTMLYAMVNQSNVKIAHKKFIS